MDYPLDKLEEMKRVKSTPQATELGATEPGASTVPTDDNDSHKPSLSTIDSSHTITSLNQRSDSLPESLPENPEVDDFLVDNTVNLDDQINNLTIGLKAQPPLFQYNQNLNNILNFSQNSVTQDFENMMSETPDLSIIYPVYSITNNQPTQSGSYKTPSESTTPSNSNLDTYINLDNFKYQDTDVHQQALLQGLSGSSVPNPLPQDFLVNYSSPAPPKSEKFLPNARVSTFKFKKLAKVEHNYRSLLIDVVIKLGPLISSGQANLLQIKELYNIWLNSFLYESYDSDLMFCCLINLTTNFLISNNFNNFNMTASKTNSFVNLTNLKNILIMISIKYYAKVIKGLRHYLNNNFNPELCSFLSYILSLMSIYDPEVTLNSITCFTNGLFSVLKYNIALSIKKGITPPILIPVHLKLMHNIEKSIYFPGYDPSFLYEFQTKLHEFGRTIKQIPLNDPQMEFLRKQYDILEDFTGSTIKTYLPVLNSNLSNNQIQQEILFKMTSKWVRFYPSRFLVVNKNSHLMEKITYLFFKLMKKGLFAVFPQVKFYFLRDFDSPLMLDVFSFVDDNEIFNSEDFDTIKAIQPFKTKLKELTAYLVRCINYFQIRLQFLYKTIVYQSSTKNLFPIEDRKDFVINIPRLRKIFYDSLGIKETNIKSFSNTLIRPYNFPHMEDMEVDVEEGAVDFLSFKGGFLNGDQIS